jgi:hypothetical protein
MIQWASFHSNTRKPMAIGPFSGLGKKKPRASNHSWRIGLDEVNSAGQIRVRKLALDLLERDVTQSRAGRMTGESF